MVRKDILAKLAALGFAVTVTPGTVSAATAPVSDPGTFIEIPSQGQRAAYNDLFLERDFVEQLALRSIGVDIT